MARILWTERLGAAANARRHLPELMRKYFTQVRELLAADPAPADLHAIRLASKRVRYTLELFQPCYGLGLKARMKSLQQLQEVLGQVSDRAAAEFLLMKLLPVSAARTRAIARLHQDAGVKAAGLRRYWFEVFDAPGNEESWARYLAEGVQRGRIASSGARPV